MMSREYRYPDWFKRTAKNLLIEPVASEQDIIYQLEAAYDEGCRNTRDDIYEEDED
jgi:hypothetical protein